MGVEVALIAGMTAVAMAGKIQQGIQTQKADNAEAGGLAQNAQLEKQAAGAEISKQDYEAVQTLGRITANAGAAGVTGVGSPELVSTMSSEEAKINDMYTKYSGRLAASRDLYAADVKKYEGRQAFTSGLIGAGESLLSGVVQGYGASKGAKTGGHSPADINAMNNMGNGSGSLFKIS